MKKKNLFAIKLILILQLFISTILLAGSGNTDGGFEKGLPPNSSWTPSSTFGGIQDFPLCGPDNGCPAAGIGNNGTDWSVWIGGIGTGVTSSVEQSFVIANSASNVTLWVLRGVCDDPSDTVNVSIDGNVIGSIACTTTDATYIKYTFDLTAGGFNDDMIHLLNIGGTIGGTNGTHSNFFLDDVGIDDVLPVKLMNFSVE